MKAAWYVNQAEVFMYLEAHCRMPTGKVQILLQNFSTEQVQPIAHNEVRSIVR